MKRSHTALAALLILASTFAYSVNECAKLSALEKKYDVSFNGCECGESIESYKELSRYGLNLVAACFDDKTNKNTETGAFYYVGNSEIDGLISYPDGPNDTLSFDTKTSGDFVINSTEEAISAVHYPKEMLGKIKGCESQNYSANAKIKIKFVQDMRAESCQNGSWVHDFEVLNIGKYSCKK